MSRDLTILAVGAAAAVACALPGTFLLLRGMSLLGDAISHAVLPGIVIAFLLSGTVSALPVVLGAGAVGLFTVFLIETLRRTRRVKEDASIAVVFPALFALGVLLVVQFAGQKDLDQECVLYGEIAYAHFDTMTLFGVVTLSRPLVVLAVVALLNLAFVVGFWKELKLSTFDGTLAAALGLSPALVHYLLMGAVSATTVASFESIGAILVVAFLIVPPATAYLLTDRLSVMLALACGIGVGAVAIGYEFARRTDTSIAGSMAVAMGLLFALAWLFAPSEGVLGRLYRRRLAADRFAKALVLERLAREPASYKALGRDLAWDSERLSHVLASLRAQGHVSGDDARMEPTPGGLAFARDVMQ